MRQWRQAMAEALYGRDGFYVRPGPGPAGHFRTSAHATPLFAAALLRLLERVDEALGRPDPLDVVDIGAGRGELLAALVAGAPPGLAARLRPTAVEVARRPADLDDFVSPGRQEVVKISWCDAPPARVTGLLVATEWLDNVPVDVAELDAAGLVRYVLVDPGSGEEALGDPVTGADLRWLERWWPLTVPGTRAEIGRDRDAAWARAVATLRRGAALAVDYGHLAPGRPPLGTLTGFRSGRAVPPVPDGSQDLTAHVALDAVAHAGSSALRTHTRPGAQPQPGTHGQSREGADDGRVSVCRAKELAEAHPPGEPVLVAQAEAVRALGVDGSRPPVALAHQDPASYLRRLAAASEAAELTDPAGLGGHYWLLQPVGLGGEAGGVARWLA